MARLYGFRGTLGSGTHSGPYGGLASEQSERAAGDEKARTGEGDDSTDEAQGLEGAATWRHVEPCGDCEQREEPSQ